METYVICIFSALISLVLAILYDPPPILTRLIGRRSDSTHVQARDAILERASATQPSTDGVEFDLPTVDDDAIAVIHDIASNSFQDIIPNEGMPLLDFVITFSARVLVLGALRRSELDLEAIRIAATDLYSTHFASTGDIQRADPTVGVRLRRLCHIAEPDQHTRAAAWSAAVAHIVIQVLLKFDAEPDFRPAFSAIYDHPSREQYHTVMVRYLTAKCNEFDTRRSHRDGAILRRQGRLWTIARRCVGCAAAASPIGVELDLEAARSREPNQLPDPFSSNAESLGLVAGIIVSVVVRNLIVEIDEGSAGLGMVRRNAAQPVM